MYVLTRIDISKEVLFFPVHWKILTVATHCTGGSSVLSGCDRCLSESAVGLCDLSLLMVPGSFVSPSGFC